MDFGKSVVRFYHSLAVPEPPDNVEVMIPFTQKSVSEIMHQFYTRYYADRQKRIFLVGINPGRLGAGSTAIPFTDPIRLKNVCGIENNLKPRPEPSSVFIYKLIEAWGGAEAFYRAFYFTSVSPVGFTRDGKNLNYYDLKELQDGWEDFMVSTMKEQIGFGAVKEVAYSLGMGKNIRHLNYLNQQHKLFDKIIPLPHPRWIMQYRFKNLDAHLQEYLQKLKTATQYLPGYR